MEFPLTGEPVALDLANTVVGKDGRTVDLLADAAGSRAWLAEQGHRLPGGKRPAHAALVELRDALREVIGAAAARQPADPGALATINAAAAQAAATLVNTADGPRSELETTGGAGPAVLAAIARSAVTLLDPHGPGLRRCAGHDCLLHFSAADRRRRYCSAATCGNRARQARHRRRLATPAA